MASWLLLSIREKACLLRFWILMFLSASLSLSLLGGVTGCATVKPWEREKLAAPCMRNPFGTTALTSEYEDKLVQTRTGGGLPGNAPGGGCGCVQ